MIKHSTFFATSSAICVSAGHDVYGFVIASCLFGVALLFKLLRE